MNTIIQQQFKKLKHQLGITLLILLVLTTMQLLLSNYMSSSFFNIMFPLENIKQEQIIQTYEETVEPIELYYSKPTLEVRLSLLQLQNYYLSVIIKLTFVWTIPALIIVYGIQKIPTKYLHENRISNLTNIVFLISFLIFQLYIIREIYFSYLQVYIWSFQETQYINFNIDLNLEQLINIYILNNISFLAASIFLFQTKTNRNRLWLYLIVIVWCLITGPEILSVIYLFLYLTILLEIKIIQQIFKYYYLTTITGHWVGTAK